jgi:predicted HTH domain antitoxin
MHVARVPYSDDILIATGRSPAEFEGEVRVLAAAKLFELRRLSIGKAAELAGLSKRRFTEELTRLGIPVINLADDQIADELRDP